MRKFLFTVLAVFLFASVGANPSVYAAEFEGADPDMTDQSAVEETDPSIEVTEDYSSEPTEEITASDPEEELEPDGDTEEVTKPNGVYDEVPVNIGPEPVDRRNSPNPESTKPIPNNWQLAFETISAGASEAAYWVRSEYNSAVASCNQSPIICGVPVAIIATAAAVVTAPAWAF